jgi:hypothetical protein
LEAQRMKDDQLILADWTCIATEGSVSFQPTTL